MPHLLLMARERHAYTCTLIIMAHKRWTVACSHGVTIHEVTITVTLFVIRMRTMVRMVTSVTCNCTTWRSRDSSPLSRKHVHILADPHQNAFCQTSGNETKWPHSVFQDPLWKNGATFLSPARCPPERPKQEAEKERKMRDSNNELCNIQCISSCSN